MHHFIFIMTIDYAKLKTSGSIQKVQTCSENNASSFMDIFLPSLMQVGQNNSDMSSLFITYFNTYLLCLLPCIPTRSGVKIMHLNILWQSLPQLEIKPTVVQIQIAVSRSKVGTVDCLRRRNKNTC
jgi:hypothetical protein